MRRSQASAHLRRPDVEDEPGRPEPRGVARSAGARYNIESLTVGHTEQPGVSRMTIVVDADDRDARHGRGQPLQAGRTCCASRTSPNRPSVVRDLALIKVRADRNNAAEIMQLAEVFRARVVDVRRRVADRRDHRHARTRSTACVDVLRPFGILEMVRTGVVAMARGAGRRRPAARRRPRRRRRHVDAADLLLGVATHAHGVAEPSASLTRRHTHGNHLLRQ